MNALRSVGVLAVLLPALALCPAASAATKVELSAEVVSVRRDKGDDCAYPNKLDVSDHGRPTGVIKVKTCGATGTGVYYSGSANLEIGAITGPAHFAVAFHPVPPNFSAAKSGTGSVRKGEEHEDLRVEGSGLPSEVGAQLRLILYAGATTTAASR